jgi:nucleoid-associated protein YgaU
VPTHTVIDGEHLWGIAADVLAATRAVDPAALTDREIHAYWVTLIAANRPALRSGDPDLIHPGEVLQLPPVTEP